MRGLISAIVFVGIAYTVLVFSNRPKAHVSIVLESIETDGMIVEYK